MDDINKIKETVDNAKEESKALAEVKEPKDIPVPQLQFEVDHKKSYTEQAKDVVGVMATQKAIEDEDLVKDITETKKEELKANANANLNEEQAKAKDSEKNLQAANYGVYEGVATYAGIKKPLPQKMQKVLFGIMSGFQVFFLILIGVPTSVFNIVADCVDSMVKKLSAIAKSAKILVIALICLGTVGLIVWIIISTLKRYNII